MSASVPLKIVARECRFTRTADSGCADLKPAVPWHLSLPRLQVRRRVGGTGRPFALVSAAHSKIPPSVSEHVDIWGNERRQPRAVSLSALAVSPKGSSSVPLHPPPSCTFPTAPALPPQEKTTLFSAGRVLAGCGGPATSLGKAARVAVRAMEKGGPPFPRAVQIWAAIWHCFPSALFSRLPGYDSRCFLTQPQPRSPLPS